jgi:myo-inositol-1(or 4)-monophosphatase
MLSDTQNLDLEFTKKLLIKASSLASEALKKPYETKWKPDNTPVTEIDLMVTKVITQELNNEYPNDAIYGEEEDKKEGQSGFTWVLDPIDGTQALGMLPTSTICLARIDPNGKPLFSVVINPTTQELFYANTERSYIDEKEMTVSEKDNLKGGYIYLGSRMPKTHASNGDIYNSIEGLGGKIFNTRSLAYSCIMVALGKAVGAYIGVSTPFEAASIKLLVENAGGKITDLDGGKIERFDTAINGLIASNGAGTIHEQLVSFTKTNN